MTSQKLIVLSGLPGSGKSTLAEDLARKLPAPVFSVDPVEAAMWRSGFARDMTGIAAYEVAVTLADEHLRLGHQVIIDAVNPVEAPRAAWRNLAARHRADLKIIECVCADQTVHRRRIEARVRGIDGMPEITWARCGNAAPNTRHGPIRGSCWTPRRNPRRNCWSRRWTTCAESKTPSPPASASSPRPRPRAAPRRSAVP